MILDCETLVNEREMLVMDRANCGPVQQLWTNLKRVGTAYNMIGPKKTIYDMRAILSFYEMLLCLAKSWHQKSQKQRWECVILQTRTQSLIYLPTSGRPNTIMTYSIHSDLQQSKGITPFMACSIFIHQHTNISYYQHYSYEGSSRNLKQIPHWHDFTPHFLFPKILHIPPP